MLAVTECFIVVAADTHVESNLSVIVGSVVPEILDHGIARLFEFFVNIFMQRPQSGQDISHTRRELRIIAEPVHTVIQEELRHLVVIGVGHIRQSILPVIAQPPPRNRSHARDTHAVFMSHIGESAGNPTLRGCPVSVVSNIGPCTEHLRVELAVGSRISVTSGGISHGNPENEFLVVGLGERLVDLRGRVAETLFGLHPRNVKVLVLEQILSGSPTPHIIPQLLAVGPFHVILFQLLPVGGKRKS